MLDQFVSIHLSLSTGEVTSSREHKESQTAIFAHISSQTFWEVLECLFLGHVEIFEISVGQDLVLLHASSGHWVELYTVNFSRLYQGKCFFGEICQIGLNCLFDHLVESLVLIVLGQVAEGKEIHVYYFLLE